MKLVKFLTFVGVALILSSCVGQLIDNITGEDEDVLASTNVDTVSATIFAIDDDGNAVIVMPVSAFEGDCADLGDATFVVDHYDAAGTLILAGATELAADHYVSDFQQIATQYEQIEYTLENVVDGDTVTIAITTTSSNDTDNEVTCAQTPSTVDLEGVVSASEVTTATQQ